MSSLASVRTRRRSSSPWRCPETRSASRPSPSDLAIVTLRWVQSWTPTAGLDALRLTRVRCASGGGGGFGPAHMRRQHGVQPSVEAHDEQCLIVFRFLPGAERVELGDDVLHERGRRRVAQAGERGR